jgi:hypothetical protein
MNSEVTYAMIQETIEGMAARVYSEINSNDGIRPETVRTLWGCVHWNHDMVNSLGGAG